MENPCYDKVNKVDCPRRHGGCAVDCPEWKKYIEERDKVYMIRKYECDANSMEYERYGRLNKLRFKKRRK